MTQPLIFTNSIVASLDEWMSRHTFDRLFFLADTRTHALCLPLLAQSDIMGKAQSIVVEPGDNHKTIATAETVWKQLTANGATRRSCLVNLGGGMITDLGGFAAATFKRGISFVNIPTTLLAMVDASVGGKTGVNFEGCKNEVGVFADARAVFIDSTFLATLSHQELCSGYAEMLKHALIHSTKLWKETLSYDLSTPNFARLQEMVRDSVAVKEQIVTEDPHEQHKRKSLNFGHTFGHAFESWALAHQTPLSHGHAVAHGMVCELYLSHVLKGFPSDKLRQTVGFIKQHFPAPIFTCNHYAELLQWMSHDKKNVGSTLHFTLLEDIGNVALDCTATEQDITEALDFLREG